MPENYQPTPEDRAPEAKELQTSNEDFLSDLEAKMDAPLSSAEQQSSIQTIRDTEDIIADRAPKDSETAKDTLEGLSEKMTADIEHSQWRELDDHGKELYNDAHILYKQIARQILNQKGHPALVPLAESAKSAIDQLKKFTEDFTSAKMDAKSFTVEVQRTYYHLVGLESLMSRLENPEL